MAFDWGSAIGAAVSLYGANRQAKAAKDAGKASADASEAGNKVIWDMFQQNRADQQPFQQAGYAGLNEYMAMMGMPGVSTQQGDPAQAYLAANPDVAAAGMGALDHYNRYGKREGRAWGAPAQAAYSPQQITNKLRSTPGYQFSFGEGQRALDSSAAARGGLFSGAAAKALTKYGQGMADQQYTSHMNRLASLAGIGQTATNTVGGYGQNAATNMANGLQNAGTARASGIAGAGDAWNAGLQDAAYFGGKFGKNQGWWG